jgi:hypothetical protein
VGTSILIRKIKNPNPPAKPQEEPALSAVEGVGRPQIWVVQSVGQPRAPSFRTAIEPEDASSGGGYSLR